MSIDVMSVDAMSNEKPILSQEGFYDLPPGMLATIVTSLEMHAEPKQTRPPPPADTELRYCPDLTAEEYRAIYRRVGQDWLWYSRLLKSDDELTSIIHHDLVDVHQVFIANQAEGLLELDYRVDGECEIAFFGLSSSNTGRGLGPWLMSEVMSLAWSRPIKRLWVHTCTFDHPSALGFYQKQGFKPFKQEVELVSDPRLDGTLPRDVAGHIPIILPPTRQ